MCSPEYRLAVSCRVRRPVPSAGRRRRKSPPPRRGDCLHHPSHTGRRRTDVRKRHARWVVTSVPFEFEGGSSIQIERQRAHKRVDGADVRGFNFLSRFCTNHSHNEPTGSCAFFCERVPSSAKVHSAPTLVHAAPRDLAGITRASCARDTVKTRVKKL